MRFRTQLILLWLTLLLMAGASIYWQTAAAPVSDIAKPIQAEITQVPTPVPTLSVAEQKIFIAKEIVSQYHDSHIYLGTNSGLPIDIFVCGDMAIDMWDMLIAKGINSVIAVGNVESKDSPYKNNHAWVMAEIEKDKWIAVEPTGGFLVCSLPECAFDDERYYTGQFFITPIDFRNCAYPSWNSECRLTTTKEEYNNP